VPYSPLGRGLLTGKLSSPSQFGEDDFRTDIPMFQGQNFEVNLGIVNELEYIAAARKCTASQIALAWLSAQGEDIFPVPGTKRRIYLEENTRSVQVKLTADEIEKINRVSRRVQGNRKNDSGMELVDT
ncbi:MAG: aldo/keto reductase, partial [Desulfobulbia bacterium]